MPVQSTRNMTCNRLLISNTHLTTCVCVNAACKSRCARSAPAKSECARRARPPNLTVRGARRHILVLITLLLAKLSHSFVRETALGRLHRLYRLGAAPRRRRSAACPLRGPPRQYVWARHVLQPGEETAAGAGQARALTSAIHPSESPRACGSSRAPAPCITHSAPTGAPWGSIQRVARAR